MPSRNTIPKLVGDFRVSGRTSDDMRREAIDAGRDQSKGTVHTPQMQTSHTFDRLHTMVINGLFWNRQLIRT